MLETYGSVGVTRFDLTLTGEDKQGRGYWPDRPLPEARSLVVPLGERAAREELNLIIYPHADPSVFLVQLDDLSVGSLQRAWFPAFLILETSPGSYQAWLAVEGGDADLARRVKHAVGADLGANGWVRLAGSRNVKPEYAPNYPTVRLVVERPGEKVTPERLHLLGLVAEEHAPEPRRERASRGQMPWRFPDYGRFLDGAPARADGEKDRSRADFTFCCCAIRWGWSAEEAAAQLLREPLSKAFVRGEAYAVHTAQKAWGAVARGRGE